MAIGMTGFGRAQADIGDYGKVSVEMRSFNHKFKDVVVHLPQSFLGFEGKIKKEIEDKITRGRVTCVVSSAKSAATARMNKRLVQEYVSLCGQIKEQFGIKDNISINTLVQLPGVLSVSENSVIRQQDWVGVKVLLGRALDELIKMRRKEGKAMGQYLKKRLAVISASLKYISNRFKTTLAGKAKKFINDDERYSFIKSTDISEELARLGFHIQSFSSKLARKGPMGKELDFIAQEMQREANTIAAKSCDAPISGRVVEIKSEVEKIREQALNIE